MLKSLQRYLDRIAYRGELQADLVTLRALQKAHVCSVPFENLDVQLGTPMSIEIEAAYEKIVINKRGGWCYEQNGLFGWALKEVGFDVTRVAASVMREERGAQSDATHLCLAVTSPGSGIRYLADVGFGGSMIEPLPLLEGEWQQPPFTIGLVKIGGTRWRFRERLGEEDFSFDFYDTPANEALLASKSDYQQDDPSSGFVLNLVVKQRSEKEYRELRGKVFSVTDRNATTSVVLDSPDELMSVIGSEFGLEVAGVAGLWPQIEARHVELFG